MSRFADPRATRTVQLGPCECPGTPHAEGDWAKVRSQLSGSDIAIISGASTTDEAAAAAVIADYVPEWNLLDDAGNAWAPSAESLVALMPASLSAIVAGVRESIAESSRLPNVSGAPSRASSRGSASHTRTATPARLT